MLAENVRTCIQILREVNPGGEIYAWSDMFDPYHNARNNYYLVRGNLTNSWLGLDAQVTILPWNFGARTNSMQWFSSRGHRQILAGYYDGTPGQIAQWLDGSQPFPGISGVMYTTWMNRYSDLEAFSGVVSDWEIRNAWQLDLRRTGGDDAVLEFPTLAGHAYTILRSSEGGQWESWSNFTAGAAVTRCRDTADGTRSQSYYRAHAP